MNNKRLKILIAGILKQIAPDSVAKVKLAKLVLFTEIEYFNKTGSGFTGLCFVRLTCGPLIAYFDETLEEYKGSVWDEKKETVPIAGYHAGYHRECNFKIRSDIDIVIPGKLKGIISKTVSLYGSKSGKELSYDSHKLPAWKHSEPNAPIYTPELAINNEADYFEMTDFMESLTEDDETLPEELHAQLSKAKE